MSNTTKKFQVGDKVRCVRPDRRDWMCHGEVFEILASDRTDGHWYVMLAPKKGSMAANRWWDQDRFEAVVEPAADGVQAYVNESLLLHNVWADANFVYGEHRSPASGDVIGEVTMPWEAIKTLETVGQVDLPFGEPRGA